MVTYSDMLKMSAQEMFDVINTLLDVRCDTDNCDRCPFYSGEYDCDFTIANFCTDNSSREKLSKPDAVHNPMHYTSGGIECWDAMQAAFGVDALKDFCKLNAFKYVWRADKKNGIEDISKAIVYLQKYIELSARQTTDILSECIKTHDEYVAQCEKEAANESHENGTA